MPVKHGKARERYRRKMDVFHQRNLRKMIGVTCKDKVTNTDILKRTGQRRLKDVVGERRFRFAGHVLRMAPECPAAHSAIDWIPVNGRRRRGKSKKTWRSTFCDDVHAIGVNWSDRVRRRSGRSCTLAKPAAIVLRSDRRN